MKKLLQIIKKNDENRAYQATHEELCNQALEHYEDISKEVCHWNSLIPKAINFYKEWGNGKIKSHITQSRIKELEALVEMIGKFKEGKNVMDKTNEYTKELDEAISFDDGYCEALTDIIQKLKDTIKKLRTN